MSPRLSTNTGPCIVAALRSLLILVSSRACAVLFFFFVFDCLVFGLILVLNTKTLKEKLASLPKPSRRLPQRAAALALYEKTTDPAVFI